MVQMTTKMPNSEKNQIIVDSDSQESVHFRTLAFVVGDKKPGILIKSNSNRCYRMYKYPWLASE